MSTRSPMSSDFADRDLRVQARRHVRILIGKTLAYFSEREDANLKLVREHLLDLIDARPTQAKAQNMRNACILLDKQAEVFNRAFQAALQTSLDEEIRVALPEAAGPEFRKYTPADPLDRGGQTADFQVSSGPDAPCR